MTSITTNVKLLYVGRRVRTPGSDINFCLAKTLDLLVFFLQVCKKNLSLGSLFGTTIKACHVIPNNHQRDRFSNSTEKS